MSKKSEKDVKTNVMRILESKKIPYDFISYECKEFIDGVQNSRDSGIPENLSYKTIIVVGKSKEHYTVVLPVADEIDLKKVARAVGEKSVSVLPVKELFAVSGYVRGGCSPVGMKKQFKTVIDISAKDSEKIYVSGGKIGLTVFLSSADLADVTGAVFEDITEK